MSSLIIITTLSNFQDNDKFSITNGTLDEIFGGLRINPGHVPLHVSNNGIVGNVGKVSKILYSLDHMPLSNSCHTSGSTERNSCPSQIVAAPRLLFK